MIQETTKFSVQRQPSFLRGVNIYIIYIYLLGEAIAMHRLVTSWNSERRTSMFQWSSKEWKLKPITLRNRRKWWKTGIRGPRFDGAVLDIASPAKLSKFRGPIEETAAAKDHKWCHPQFRYSNHCAISQQNDLDGSFSGSSQPWCLKNGLTLATAVVCWGFEKFFQNLPNLRCLVSLVLNFPFTVNARVQGPCVHFAMLYHDIPCTSPGSQTFRRSPCLGLAWPGAVAGSCSTPKFSGSLESLGHHSPCQNGCLGCIPHFQTSN